MFQRIQRLTFSRRSQRSLLIAALLALAALPFFLGAPSAEVEASLNCEEPDYSNCVNNCTAILDADTAVCESLYPAGPQRDNCLYLANLSCDSCLLRCEFLYCKIPV